MNAGVGKSGSPVCIWMTPGPGVFEDAARSVDIRLLRIGEGSRTCHLRPENVRAISRPARLGASRGIVMARIVPPGPDRPQRLCNQQEARLGWRGGPHTGAG